MDCTAVLSCGFAATEQRGKNHSSGPANSNLINAGPHLVGCFFDRGTLLTNVWLVHQDPMSWSAKVLFNTFMGFSSPGCRTLSWGHLLVFFPRIFSPDKSDVLLKVSRGWSLFSVWLEGGALLQNVEIDWVSVFACQKQKWEQDRVLTLVTLGLYTSLLIRLWCFCFLCKYLVFFLLFSLDLCPGKQKEKERIHGQSGKKVSQPPSCLKQANSTSCGTGKGSSCGCWDSSMHRVPAAISWQWLRKALLLAAACRGQDCACLQQVAKVPTNTSHLKLGHTQLYWPSPQAAVLA